jgi:hypothetical protein
MRGAKTHHQILIQTGVLYNEYQTLIKGHALLFEPTGKIGKTSCIIAEFEMHRRAVTLVDDEGRVEMFLRDIDAHEIFESFAHSI